MKLEKARHRLLLELATAPQVYPDRYKPATWAAQEGYAIVRRNKFGIYEFQITPAGRAALEKANG